MSVRPKVVVVAPCPFFIDRGTPIRIKRLATALSSEFDIHVVAYGQGRDGDFPFTIHRTPKLPFSIKRAGANLAKLCYDPLLFFTLLRTVRRERIGVIDGHLHEGALLGLMVRLFTGAKVIYNAHGTLVPELIATGALKQTSPLVKPLAAFELWVERRVDRIVAQSVMRRDEFIAQGHDPAKVSVVEDVPELDDFDVPDDQVDRDLEQRLRPHGERLLIYSGGMETYQGVDFLIDAFAEVSRQRRDVKLVLFGRPLEEYCRIIAGLELADRVVFVDDEPFERLPQYLKICDIGFALRLYGENVPGKLPIYLASGIAVVGTDAKGINTVITHNDTGMLVPPNDVPALVTAILDLLDDPQKLRTIGARGKAEARRRYDPNEAARELGKVYRELLATTR
jgi:glycosyltransferase involved in cell wall biosynthesis